MDNNQQQQDQGKQQKKFAANMQKLAKLLGGEDKLKAPKIPQSSVANLVSELLKEEQEQVEKSFKEKGKAIIKRHLEYQRFVKQQENEFKKKVTEQMTAFNKEVEDLFQLIENHQSLQQSFTETLSGATTEEEKGEEGSEEQS